MSPLLILLLAAIGTYGLRVLFISLVPANRLPERVRTALQLVGPAALAALVTTDIAHAAGHPTRLWPTVAAVLMAGVIAAVTKNLAFTILGGLAAAVAMSIAF